MADTSEIPSSFMADLLKVWGKDTRSFEKPFAPVMSAEAAFRGFLAARDRMLVGDSSIPIRVFGDGVEIVSNLPSYVPLESDRSMEGYLRRISAERDDRRFGVMVKNFQAIDSALWSRLAVFLERLFSEVPRPTWNYVDLFFGNYRRTFFGLHKDDVDVVTFVLHGHKRFLVWPFESLADVPGVEEAFRYAQYSLGGDLVDRYRDRATVIEGHAGDVLYWPASHWHIAETTGSVPITLSLALLAGDAPPSDRWLQSAGMSLMQRLSADAGPVHARLSSAADRASCLDGIAGLSKRLADPSTQTAFRRAVARAACAEATRFGFVQVPRPRATVPLTMGDHIRMVVAPQCHWLRVDDALVCGHYGSTVETEAGEAASAALEQLRSGTDASVGNLLARESISGEREELLTFLTQLHAIHAIERA